MNKSALQLAEELAEGRAREAREEKQKRDAAAEEYHKAKEMRLRPIAAVVNEAHAKYPNVISAFRIPRGNHAGFTFYNVFEPRNVEIHSLTGNRVRMLKNGYYMGPSSCDDVADLIPVLIDEIAKELISSGTIK